jgi:hypothetical protein
MSTQRIYWLLQALGWGGYAIAQAYAAVFIGELPALPIVKELLILHGSGMLLTHLLRLYMKNQGWFRLSLAALAPRILASSALLSIPLAVAMNSMTIAAVVESESSLQPAVKLSLHVASWGMIILIWLILYFAIVAIREQRFARSGMLRSQLNPQFIFSSLNSVHALIATDPARAQLAVSQLASTLRYTFTASGEEMVALEQELSIVDDYLALELLRLGDRLVVRRDISEDAKSVRLPVMLLQTVVQNGINLGVDASTSAVALHISAQIERDSLMLEVEAPRPSAPAQPAHDGAGLRHAAERLRHLFGDNASLNLDLSHPDFTVARVRIPRGT